MSQPTYQPRRAAGRSRSKTSTRTSPETAKGGSSPAKRPPFSPNGSHGALRGLLLSVGNVLARDENVLLSKVSLSILRKGLSDFLSASRQDEGDYVGGTSHTGRQASTAGSGAGRHQKTPEETKIAQKKLLTRRAQDDIIIARLKKTREDAANGI